jgi:hypothetical protein
MDICDYCGGEIIFRYIGGVCTPVHLSGGCNSDYTRSNGKSYTNIGKKSIELDRLYQAEYTYEDFCYPTKCPKCGEEVYFIRHNGGVVWVDELGWPWPKHPCMDNSSGWQCLNIVGRADIDNIEYGLCTKVKIIKNKERSFLTYINILFSDKKEKTFLIDDEAYRLLGSVVSIGRRKNNLFIYSPESVSYKIINNNVADDIFNVINEIIIHCPICRENIKKSYLFSCFEKCKIEKCPKHKYSQK